MFQRTLRRCAGNIRSVTRASHEIFSIVSNPKKHIGNMPLFWLQSFIVFAALFLCGLKGVRAESPSAPAPYQNSALPLQQRVDDLVSRMTLEEKIAQMQNETPAIPRLGIPSYDWWNEGLHGIARSGYATVFPQAIGLAATWDTPLIQRVADTISTEARAKYNQAQREKNYSIYYGLTIWSPNINIARDPRWGRGQETYGEDPFLTGSIGAAFVRGLQGYDPRYYKTLATAKHYAVHSGPESLRHNFDGKISPYDLQDTYLSAFRRLVEEAKVGSVMCAYNAVDGAPACASKLLLEQTLRNQWNFQGPVVSDCAAITDIAEGHRFSPDKAHASAAAVKAGTDLSCGKEYASLNEAVQKKLITEAEIDTSVKRLMLARFRLGMFDPQADVPYNTIPFSENDSAEHHQQSLATARASIVLLKNEKHILPLSSSLKTIAVIGPNADALSSLEGNYNAIASHSVTPLQALESRFPGHVLYAQGSPYVDGIVVPVPANVFTLFPTQNSAQGLKAEYFSGLQLEGKPVVEQVDRSIQFDWNGASPVAGVSPQQFSVRWTGAFTAPAPGTLHFNFSMAHCSTCEDVETIHVWLDGKQVYEFVHDRTHGRRAPTTPFTMTFTDTAPHPIRIEYTHDAPHFGAGLTFNWHPPLSAMRQQAVEAAKKSDMVLLFLGLSPEIEGEEMPVHVEGFEGGDRSIIELPAAQQQLAETLAATGKPIILVLMNGNAIALQSTEKESSAILEAWYPGAEGGTAIVETLFGENNPAGRLPITFYASTSQLPSFEDYSMQQRTYRYFTGNPLYPFGYGLSYTTFQYSGGELKQQKLQTGDALQASVMLKNSGDRDSDEVVEAYLIAKGKKDVPLRSLVGFTRVHLAKGESRRIALQIDPDTLSFVHADGSRSIDAGLYELYIGGSQPVTDSGVFLPFKIEGQSRLIQ